MKASKISAGTVHAVPKDVRQLLSTSQLALATWGDITPLARNEWLCWVESAKLIETRQRRVLRLERDLASGKRRPCCWAGCIHRQRTGK